jgi:hypothetical protein
MVDAQSTMRTDDILSRRMPLRRRNISQPWAVPDCQEQRLMLAVLVDAINVLQSWQDGGSARKRRNFADAAQWVNMRGTAHPFSFDNVCAALEIDSELLGSRTLTVRSANSAREPRPRQPTTPGVKPQPAPDRQSI